MNKTQKIKATFDNNAKLYQDKFMDVSLYHEMLEIFCSNLHKQNSQVLDIACGPGNITRHMLQRRPDLYIMGIDIAENMLELAEKNNPGAKFINMDARHIATIGRKFDGVICGFCLPYLLKDEAVKLIGDAAKILNSDGVLYLSTMEDDNSKSGWKRSGSGKDELYMSYHEAAYLVAALETSGFYIINIKRQRYAGADGADVTDLEIVARINT